jgi:SAM-dependent methyltransferase
MSRRLNLPDSASVAESSADGRMFAPSTARNAAAILEVVARFAPESGTGLEIASGTGEHVAQFAKTLPGLTWQPSDIDPDRIASIRAWTRELPNVHDPIRLDVTETGWSGPLASPNLIFLSNLLHLISQPEAQTAVTEAARLLAPGGWFLVYGPFRRGIDFASQGDHAFDASLRSQDPEIGYKPFETVQAWQSQSGLQDLSVTNMPANNLILAGRRPTTTT